MAFASWQSVVDILTARTGPPTAQQIRLGSLLRVDVPAGVPGRVYAAALRRHVASELELRRSPPPTAGQLDLLSSLSEEVERPTIGQVPDADCVDAWVQTFFDLRSITALTANEFAVGDIVDVGPIRGLAEVSSIGADGALFFRGGQGSQARPHRVRLVSRAAEPDEEPGSPRYEAKQQLERKRTVRTEIGMDRLRDLEDWAVRTRPTPADVALLEETLEGADDERPLQRLLAERPQLISPVVGDHHMNYVAAEPRLGGRYIPDFVVGGLNSHGLIWTLVEIESPKARTILRGGGPAENCARRTGRYKTAAIGFWSTLQ